VHEGQRRRRRRPAHKQLAAAEAVLVSIRHKANFDISKPSWR
jgi:hypothetical protein